jgi:hypothetical protein
MKPWCDETVQVGGQGRLTNGKSQYWILWVLLVGLFWCSPLAAEPLPTWVEGDSWQIRAIYRQPDGTWSAPVNWLFSVTAADATLVQVEVQGGGNSRAQLIFERQTGQLRRIGLTDLLRDEEVYREIRIDGSAPVYPLFSAIPYFFPVYSHEAVRDTHLLQRYLNGRKLPAEEVTQVVETFNARELSELMPSEAASDAAALVPGVSGFVFRIGKSGGEVFTQYWSTQLPWAIYTESPACKAWIAR